MLGELIVSACGVHSLGVLADSSVRVLAIT